MKRHMISSMLAIVLLFNTMLFPAVVAYAEADDSFQQDVASSDDNEKADAINEKENAHIHELNYTLENGSVVEQCACGHIAQAFLSFVEDVTNITSDGTAKEPALQVVFSDNWQSGKEQPAIVYTNNTLPGQATASVIIEGVEISLNFTIKPTEQSEEEYVSAITVVSGAVTWSYDESTKKLTISGSGEMDAIPLQGESEREEVISVEVEAGITSLKASAFANMTSLKDVSLPDGLTKIEPRAFQGCTALEEIFLPDSIISMGDRIFNGCTSLKTVNFPKSWKETPYTYYGILYNYIRGEIFSDCPSLTSITVPEGITEIPEAAFSKASFRHVYLPETLQEIGSDAFIGSAIEEIVIPKTVTRVAGFARCPNLQRVEYQSDSMCTEIEFNCFEDCVNLQEVLFPQALEIIRSSAFADCKSLDNIVFPENVTYIDEYAFSGCTSLKSIALPEKMKAIGYRAFSGCSSLEEITIPAAFEEFRSKNTMPGDEGGAPLTFAGCTSLKNYHVSQNNKRFSDIDGILCNKAGTSIIHWPAGRTTVEFPQTITSFDYKSFSTFHQQEILIPSHIKTIGRYAFAGSSVESVTFEAGELRISEYGFYNTSLKTLQWPEDMRSLDLSSGAFSSCEELENVVLPECITSLENATYCFSSCKALKAVNFPLGVNTIPKGFLRACSSLESLMIPANITSIDREAFGGAGSTYAGLKTLFFEGNAPTGLTSESLPEDVQIYYPGLATGWTTPTWNGYSAQPNLKFGLIDVTPNVDDEYVLPNIDLTQTITLRFNRKIGEYQGNLYLYEYDTDQLVATFNFMDAKKADDFTLEFVYPNAFESATCYYILIDDAFAVDSGTPAETADGISCKDVWYFRAADSSTYLDALSEEDLFLKYPQFLSDDIRMEGIEQTFNEVLNRNLSSGDQWAASINWVLKNLTINPFEMGSKIVELEKDSLDNSLSDIFQEASNQKPSNGKLLEDFNEQIGAMKEAFDLLSTFRSQLLEEYPSLDQAGSIENWEGAKFNDLVNALYDLDPGTFRTAFPEWNSKGGIAGYLEATDFSDEFDKAYDEKMKNLGQVISGADWAVGKLNVLLEYSSARSISLEITNTFMDEFIAESKKHGYDDDLYIAIVNMRRELAEGTLTPESVSEYIINESILKTSEIFLEFIDDISGGQVFKVEKIAQQVGKYIGRMMDSFVPSADEVLKTYNYAAVVGRTRWLLKAQINWFQEYEMTSRDIETFRTIYYIYVSSLIELGDSLYNLHLTAKDEMILSEHMDHLKENKNNLYDLFLQDCLYTARPYLETLHTKLRYEVRNGKAYITGFADTTAQNMMFAASESVQLPSIADKKTWLTIPQEIDGYPVAGIDSNAFAGDSEIQAIYIKPELEFVGENAFRECTNLKTVLFMGGIREIRDSAFYGSGLQSIKLSKETQSVGNNAFSSCRDLQTVIAESAGVVLGENAFDANSDVLLAGLENSTVSDYAQQNGIGFEKIKGKTVAANIMNLPVSQECTIGEKPNTDGMILEVTFADGSKEEISQGWHILCDTTKLGETQVYVCYGEVEVQYTVTVISSCQAGHDWSKDYLAENADANRHYHICTVCGIKDLGAEHIPGPEATEKNPQICIVCNYELLSALEHTHIFDTTIWKHDSTNHWRECRCGEKSEMNAHIYNNALDDTCSVCAYVRTIDLSASQDSVNEVVCTPPPEATVKSETNDSKNNVSETPAGQKGSEEDINTHPGDEGALYDNGATVTDKNEGSNAESKKDTVSLSRSEIKLWLILSLPILVAVIVWRILVYRRRNSGQN